MELLLLLFLGLGGIAAMAMDGSEQDEVDTAPEDDGQWETITGTEGNDTLSIAGADGPEGVSDLHIHEFSLAEWAIFPVGSQQYEDIVDPSQLDAGEGDDLIQVHDGASSVDAGAGNDTVTGSAASVTIVDAGTGDDLIDMSAGEAGHASSLVVSGTGADTFMGGEGEDWFFGTSSFNGEQGTGGDIAYGNGGNDTLLGSYDADLIDGGDGDDFLSSVRDVVEYHPSEGSGFPNVDALDYADSSADTLIGGEGNDTLTGDGMDVMTGGAGVDTFNAYLRPQDPGEAVTVTDFDPETESLTLTIHFDEITTPPSHWDDALDWEAGIILDLMEAGGDTLVQFEGETLAVLQGVTGVPASAVAGEVFMPYDRW
ncbi:calcium-binding protein [Thalassovita sp.]|uniref:calcium-binding protein n=1 Tax=Thalassovita sp. TaxID=1979401 RepID=UPI002B269EDD|nr:calcium-binding protein [Thalassovita sp.]